MFYVAVDTETTGLGSSCEILELAMVAEDTKNTKDTPVEDLPYFRALFLPDNCVWETEALRMHAENGLLRELFESQTKGKFFIDHWYVWKMAARWLEGMTLDRFIPPEGCVLQYKGSCRKMPGANKIIPAGKNFSGFDKLFLPAEVTDLFDYRALDPGSVFVDFDKERLPGMQEFKKEGDVKHRALDDARAVVRALRTRYGGLQ